MDKIKTYFTDKAAQIIVAVVIIATGIFLLARPGTSLVTICYALGAAALIKGIATLIKSRLQNGSKTGTASGVGFIVVAVVLFLHPQFLLSIIPVIVGIFILGYGIASLFAREKSGMFGKISAVLSVIIGVAVIVSPFKFAEAVTSIIGLALVIVGAMIIVAQITAMRYGKLPTNEPTDGYNEVDFTDVDD